MTSFVEDISGGVGDIVGSFVGGITGQTEVNELARELANRDPLQFTAGGFRTRLTGPDDNRRLRVRSSRKRRDLVSGIRDVLSRGASELSDIRTGVDTPLTRLREAIVGGNEAALQRIEDARRRTIGDLSQNLRRRRVLGSSFGQDQIARGGAEFGRLKAEQETQAAERLARTALAELDIRTDLIERETAFAQQALQTSLDELNLEANLAANLAAGFDQTLQRNRETLLEVMQAGASGVGQIIGTGIGVATGIAAA